MKDLCKVDLEQFARSFFPHLCRLPFSPMHRELFCNRAAHVCERLPNRSGRREALAAPRGNAKSTIKSLLFLLHDLAYGLERYILLFSATLPQAEQRLKNLRREIEKNELLQKTYKKEFAKTGPWTNRSLSVGGVLIEAHSAGCEVRGISSGQWRPTKIILDDVEDSQEVENVELRERLYDWFREVVENLGDRYTHIDLVGTVLHPDSLLSRLLERPDFEATRWQSIAQFAQRQDLWEEWNRIYTDLGNQTRQALARRFFNARRDEMLQGAEVLWPQKEDYYELMVQHATRGRRAFFKEKQNQPLKADHAVFDLSTFRWFRRQGSQLIIDPSDKSDSAIPLSSLTIVGFLDSAMGRSTHQGDFASIATVGVDPAGRLYLLDVWLDRATPSEQARRIFQQHELWNYARFGIEAIGFQGLIAEPIETLRRERKARGEKSDLCITELTPRASKIQRVAALEPLIHNGWLLFERALSEEFLAQVEAFPAGRHDDGPDALASAVELARQNTGSPQLLQIRRKSCAARGF